MNTFAKYRYRSLEDIMEAVKPLLAEHSATLTLDDKLEEVGGRVYICSTACLRADKETWRVTAYAREPLARKGMDEPQLTGTASSYARKYALAGLLLLDDTQDVDSMPPRDEEPEQLAPAPVIVDGPPKRAASKQPLPTSEMLELTPYGDGKTGTDNKTYVKVAQAVSEGRIKAAKLRDYYVVGDELLAELAATQPKGK